MKTRINKKIILGLVVVFLCFNCFIFSVQAQSFGKASEQLDSMAKMKRVDLKKNDVPKMIGLIIYGILGLLGVICLVLVIAGGVIWMTAGGNEESVKKARGIIKGAVIGVIVILAAYALTYFVVDTVLKTVRKDSAANNPADNSTLDCSFVNCSDQIVDYICNGFKSSEGVSCCYWDFQNQKCVGVL